MSIITLLVVILLIMLIFNHARPFYAVNSTVSLILGIILIIVLLSLVGGFGSGIHIG